MEVVSTAKGFSRAEGHFLNFFSAIQVFAVVGMGSALAVMGYLWLGVLGVAVYLCGQLSFVTLYRKRLCVECENICPYNTNIDFRKETEAEA